MAPCDKYSELERQRKSASDSLAYFTYDENKTLRGTSERKSKEMARQARQRLHEEDEKMDAHRAGCAECKANTVRGDLMLYSLWKDKVKVGEVQSDAPLEVGSIVQTRWRVVEIGWTEDAGNNRVPSGVVVVEPVSPRKTD